MKRFLLLPALLAMFQLQAQQIEEYRYWINDDPAGVTVAGIGPNVQVNLVSDLVLPALTKDYNTITIQFKDTSDVYSVPLSRIFTRNTGAVTGYEYWIDDAVASRVTETITPGNTVNIVENIPLCLTAGAHLFTIRFQGASGTWSVPITRQFTSAASPDTDGDGLCDAQDPCPALANVIPGQSCNDNDACTVNDVVDVNCNCAGTFADGDNDGTCDASDLCPGGPEPGTLCNDGNANTSGDVVGPNCICAGALIDCLGVAGGSAVPGTPCNDNDDCTANDIYQLDCGCAGTFQDNDGDGTCDANDLCPGGPEPGTACNDNDACTTGDVIGANCLCAGTFADADADGTCDANDLCPGGPEPGAACNDNNTCTTGDVFDANCLCVGTFADADADGTCDASDLCPGGPEPGATCNDNNAATINDIIQANCSCAGTLLGNDCNGVPGGPAVPGTSCNDNNACTTGDVFDANCLCTGTFADADGDGTCDANDLCPGGPEPGTPCNDNNAATINDIIQTNCSCAGTLLGNDCNGVPGGPAVPGTSCNDNNVCTTGDVFDASCLCAGTFADADVDGTCDANDLCPGGPEPGTACNDNDACTTGDVIGANCLCAGTFADADADGTCDANDLCPGGPEPGTACNDNSVCTTGDVIGTNCLCAGTFQDADADGTCDANDNCPSVVGQIGSACNDNNAGTTNDMLNASCQCVGTPIVGCTENLTLSVKLDGNPTQTTWTLLDAATETVTIASGGFTAGQANTTVVVPICVPVGCYHLRVNDSGSNGITNGGYVLRDASSRRIIDASLGSFSSVSQINTGNNPNRSFCVPISNIGMQTATSCDKVRPRTSPIYANTQPGATGYQFWIYDPHGTYNRRVLKTTNQLVPASLLTSPVPSNLDLNVRVRSLTGTVYSEFGPACRIRFTGGVAPAMGEGHSREMEEALSSEVPLTIYPNPNRDGQLTISMEGLEIADGATVDVVIYDLLGKPVVSETAPVAEGMLNHRMDLAGRIGQGLYVVNVTVDGKLYNQRLVMQ